MKYNFNSSYMAMNWATYIPVLALVKYYVQLIYTDYANYAYFDKRSHIKPGVFIGGSLFK